ncbi:hypothetical protein EYF80_030163 [Liparis tanakae]|uniref:Uncharacterized protein n=1 Tax=Liparis tanakae TaxID=230148 RepID=A0A4Z2H1Y4_9TELE|nr:hypothetical protein EYF80_030163 [Liparis tanakae]
MSSCRGLAALTRWCQAAAAGGGAASGRGAALIYYDDAARSPSPEKKNTRIRFAHTGDRLARFATIVTEAFVC